MNQYLVLLVDRKHGHFYWYEDAKLTALEEVTEDMPKSVKSASWAGLADDKVNRHIEEHVAEHYRHLISVLERYLDDKDKADAEVIIGGPDAEVSTFQTLLPRGVADRLVAIVHPEHYVGLKELEAQIAQAVKAVGSNHTIELMAQIENERQPNGKGVVGQEPVYEALNMKEVQTLLIKRGHGFTGMVCPVDGSLASSQTQCPACLGPMDELPDLLSAIQAKAAEQQATVYDVDADIVFPDEYEGIAALKRFTR